MPRRTSLQIETDSFKNPCANFLSFVFEFSSSQDGALFNYKKAEFDKQLRRTNGTISDIKFRNSLVASQDATGLAVCCHYCRAIRKCFV